MISKRASKTKQGGRSLLMGGTQAGSGITVTGSFQPLAEHRGRWDRAQKQGDDPSTHLPSPCTSPQTYTFLPSLPLWTAPTTSALGIGFNTNFEPLNTPLPTGDALGCFLLYRLQKGKRKGGRCSEIESLAQFCQHETDFPRDQDIPSVQIKSRLASSPLPSLFLIKREHL